MHFLYIIYSRSIGTYYVGETHDMDERLAKHNNHIYSKGFTKSANDWTVALKFECRSREDALYLERFVKRMKSKTFINRIIQKPSILEDLLSQKMSAPGSSDASDEQIVWVFWF